MSLQITNEISVALIDDDLNDCLIVKDVLDESEKTFTFEYRFSVPEFKQLIKDKQPDLVLIDICIPHGKEGYDVLAWIKEFYPEIKSLVFTSKSLDVLEAIANEADGFMTKSERTLLPKAAEEIMNNGIYVSPKNGKRLFDQIKNVKNKFAIFANIDLTIREKEILKILCSETSRKKSAKDLNTPEMTLKAHIREILKKFSKALGESKKIRTKNVINEYGMFFKFFKLKTK